MLGLTLALVVHYCLIADTDANYAPAYTPILFSECIPVIHNRTYEAKDPQSYIYCNTDGIFVQKQCSNSKVYSPAAGRCVDQRFQSVFSRLRIQNIQEDALGCPTNQVAHVDVATNQPSSCTPSSTGTGSGCPLGFGCWFSSSQQMNLCCGLDAGCPANSAGFINTQSGTAQSCLTTSTTPCADGFHCVSSTNTALGTVCCSKTDTDPVNTCPNGSPAVMSGNVMLQCATSVNCPAGYTCTQISDKKGCCIQGTDGSTPDIVCAQPINAGSTCSAGSILPSTRFHFDPVTKQCASFQYLGCNGNQNNFHTLDECHSFCGPTVCPAGSPLISQGTTGTFAQCSNGVASCPIYYTCTPVDRVSMCCPDKDRACALPMDQGIPCTDAPASTRQRWYFSPSTQTCTQFTFRGCQGNDNRFTSQAKCQQICGGSSTSTKGNCPNGVTPASPQDCLINQIPSTCQSGYSCQYSSTSVPICCVTSGLTQAQCPTTFVPEIDTVTGEPKVCIPGYSNTRCSSTFSCTPSTVNTVYTCCRKPGGTVERGTDECPNGELMEYTEALAPKFCVPNFANTCTAGYVCLLSTQVNHVCCLGDPVCPSGMQRYNLPNTQRQPLTCTPTGAGNECPTSYFCVTSSIPRLSICCQPDPQNTQSQCPNDAEPYLTPLRNEVMPCYGSECPNGFTCVPSQLNSATTICCSTDRRVHAACEGGSMPLVDAQGNPMTCSAQSCPIGYYCSTSFTPQPVCCLSSSYGATCPPGMIGYTAPGTTGVQTCASATDSSCPTGFRCVGKASGYACCAAENLAGCANGRQRYISPVSQGPQFCTVELPSCPQGYACSPSTLFAQMICCASSVSNTGTTPVTVAPTPSNTDICPSGYPPLPTFGGIAAICSATTPCPNGYSCLPSLTRPNVNVCCASTNFVTTPYPVAPQTQYPGVSQTQVPTEVYPTCLTGGTPAFVPGTTDRRHCSPQSQFVQCPTGYNCEPSTVINEYICCTPGTHGPALRCTYPAIEYRANANDVAVECTTNPSDCSGGSICETAANVPDRKVCCIAPGQPGTGTTGTGTSQQNNVCQNGKKPLLTSDRSPLQCRASSSLSCAYGYDCERNGQDGLYYCCGAETPGPTVTSAPVTSVPGTGGVEGGCPERTYALVNAMGAPQTCHVGSPNACPQGFQCVFSIPYLRWQCCSVLSTSFVSPTTKDIRQTTAMIITAPSTTTRRMGHVGTPCLSEQRCFDANAYCIPRVEHCACRPGYMLSGPLECVPEGLVGG